MKYNFKPYFSYNTDDNTITALTISNNEKYIVVGNRKGIIHVFEHHSEKWNISLKSHVNNGSTDLRFFNRPYSERIVSLNFVPISRVSPLLICTGLHNLSILSLSERHRPDSISFEPDGLSFPPKVKTHREATCNQVATYITKNGILDGTAVSPDGLYFSYIDGQSAFYRKIDNPDPFLITYKSDTNLTKVDICSNFSDLHIFGDDLGRVAIVDPRIKPTLNDFKLRSPEFEGEKSISPVLDCKFSPDCKYFYSRHYSDLFIWDIRFVKKAIKHFPIAHEANVPPLFNGADVFLGTWIDNTVLTGSYGDSAYECDLKSAKNKPIIHYITETGSKMGKTLFLKEKKMKYAKERNVSNILFSSQSNIIAATNASSLFLYSL